MFPKAKITSLEHFFLQIRQISFFDHLIVDHHHGCGFAKVHTFGFDDLELPLVVLGFDQLLDFRLEVFAT